MSEEREFECFEVEEFKTMGEVLEKVVECEIELHTHQVVFSTYHQAFTQICFTCKRVRTNMGV